MSKVNFWAIHSSIWINPILSTHKLHGHSSLLPSIALGWPLGKIFSCWVMIPPQIPIFVARIYLYHDTAHPWILPKHSINFIMTIIHTKYPWSLGPQVVIWSFHGCFGHQFKICDRFSAVSHGCANAISSCIIPTNYNHILSSSIYELTIPLKF